MPHTERLLGRPLADLSHRRSVFLEVQAPRPRGSDDWKSEHPKWFPTEMGAHSAEGNKREKEEIGPTVNLDTFNPVSQPEYSDGGARGTPGGDMEIERFSKSFSGQRH